MVAMPVSWLPLAADYTRFSKNPRGAFWGASVGYFIPNVWLYALGAILLLTRGLADAPSVITAIATGGVGAALALVALGVDETKEPFANIYSAAVSLQNLLPRVPQRLLILGVAAVATAGAFVVESRPLPGASSYLLGSFFVPALRRAARAMGRGQPRSLPRPGDPACADRRVGSQASASTSGSRPVGPSSWIHLVEHTNPGQGAIGRLATELCPLLCALAHAYACGSCHRSP
jgi:hypothetical protein